MKYFLFVFLFSVFFSGNLFSSDNRVFKFTANSDSTVRKRKHVSPEDSVKRLINKEATRASLMSMILPGLGQAYNGKYWKIPLIYAALGGIGYFFMEQNGKYQNAHNELIYRYTYPYPTFSYNSFTTLNTDQLNTEKLLYKKHRDFLIIGMGMVYLINIIDANVGAHMKTFDVSDKLSMTIAPKAFYCNKSPYNLAGGISIALNFK